MMLGKGIERYNKKTINDAPYSKFLTGVIVSNRNSVSGYVVKVNGVSYTNLLALNGVNFNVNDVVQLVVPNNQMNNMFILGKLS